MDADWILINKMHNGDEAAIDAFVRKYYPSILKYTDYIVRRLTPTECARLQGFPDWWCDELGIEEPTEEDVARWRDIFETHAKALGKKGKGSIKTSISNGR